MGKLSGKVALVTGAGRGIGLALAHKISDEQWDAIQDVHLKAPFRILRAAYPHIKARSDAERQAGLSITRKVVNVSSVSATRGSAGQSNYAAAKAGLFGLTKSLCKEWGPMNVTVNSVFVRPAIHRTARHWPGSFAGPLQPVLRHAEHGLVHVVQVLPDRHPNGVSVRRSEYPLAAIEAARLRHRS